jgi:hypothetical protein
MILEENRRLSALVAQSGNTGAVTLAASTISTLRRADNVGHKPIIGERPWFMSFYAADLLT